MAEKVPARRRRGPFGIVILCLFVAFNLYFGSIFAKGIWALVTVDQRPGGPTSLIGFGLGMIGGIWLIGGAILGALVLASSDVDTWIEGNKPDSEPAQLDAVRDRNFAAPFPPKDGRQDR